MTRLGLISIDVARCRGGCGMCGVPCMASGVRGTMLICCNGRRPADPQTLSGLQLAGSQLTQPVAVAVAVEVFTWQP